MDTDDVGNAEYVGTRCPHGRDPVNCDASCVCGHPCFEHDFEGPCFGVEDPWDGGDYFEASRYGLEHPGMKECACKSFKEKTA